MSEWHKEQAREIDQRDSGCLCQLCGLRYKVDFMLPDDTWAEIQTSLPRNLRLLCGTCIVFQLEKRGEPDYFDLIKVGSRPTANEKSKSAPLQKQRRRKSRREQEAEALRASDLSGQLSERDNIEYGHHDSLPRGEHVARLKTT